MRTWPVPLGFAAGGQALICKGSFGCQIVVGDDKGKKNRYTVLARPLWLHVPANFCQALHGLCALMLMPPLVCVPPPPRYPFTYSAFFFFPFFSFSFQFNTQEGTTEKPVEVEAAASEEVLEEPHPDLHQGELVGTLATGEGWKYSGSIVGQ